MYKILMLPSKNSLVGFLLLFNFVGGAAANANLQDDDPFRSTQSGSAPDLHDSPPDADGFRVPLAYDKTVTIGIAGCPKFVIGNEVWDGPTLKVSARLHGSYDAQGLRALSDDGRWFAASSKSPNQQDTTVSVWSTASGEIVLEVPGDAEKFADFVKISRNQYLLIGGRHNNQLEVWDIEAGSRLPKTITVPDRRIEPDGKTVFSPDGKSFATIAHDTLILTSTASGKPIVAMDPPGSLAKQTGNRSRERAANRSQPAPNADDAGFVFAWTTALEFSPNGEELAAFSTHPYPRLLIWNIKGKLLVDEPMLLPKLSVVRSSMQWTPDSRWLLYNGWLIERESRKVVLCVRIPTGAYIAPVLLSSNQIACNLSDRPEDLQVISIPWEDLSKSLKKVATAAPARLSPSQPISLKIEANTDDVRVMLTELLTQRLTQNGLQVQTGVGTVFRMAISERAGESLPIYESQSPADRRGRNTGRTATEVEGAAVLEWHLPGEVQPVWRGHLTAQSGRTFSEEIHDGTMRQSMLQGLILQLQGLEIPYYIPESSEELTLPAIIE